MGNSLTIIEKDYCEEKQYKLQNSKYKIASPVKKNNKQKIQIRIMTTMMMMIMVWIMEGKGGCG